MKFTLLALCATLAASARIPMEIQATVASSYTNWVSEQVDDADSTLMTIFVMMKHAKADIQKLEQVVLAVSDPKSPAYGKHLSIEQVGQITPIADSAVNTVLAFLKAEGVTTIDINLNRDMIEVELSIAQANKLFETDVRLFSHKRKAGVQVLRSVSPYSLPEEVAEVVSFVADLLRVPSVRESVVVDVDVDVGGLGQWDNACDGISACKGLVTPAVCRKRYGISDSDDVVVQGNSIDIVEFQGQFWSQSDIDTFNSGCHVAVNVSRQIGSNTGKAGVEAMLDIEYAGGVAPSVPMTVRYIDKFSLLGWCKNVNNDPNAALVHSVSYGNDEAQQTSGAYMDQTAVQFQKAAARGLSILFASGDQGVCGREGCGFFRHKFHPDFPAAMPWVTAVGGTDFVTYEIGEEKVWKSGGGGFSDHFAIPSWQADAVANYKATANLPDQSLWNNTGRGYPDLAALGGQKTPYCVVAGGRSAGVAGTSASCPVVASIFAMLNGVRLQAGKSPLGFLNPFIYGHMSLFNDVTQGQNNDAYKVGFEAVKGWDASSGVGTPDFSKLKAAVLALP